MLKQIENIVEKLSKKVMLIGGGIIAIVAISITSTAICRFYCIAIFGVTEVSSQLMVIIIGLGIGAVQVDQSHICVESVMQAIPEKGQKYINLIIKSICGLLFLVLGHQQILLAIKAYEIHAVLGGVAQIPTWPAKAFLSLGLLYTSLAFFLQVIATVIRKNRKY